MKHFLYQTLEGFQNMAMGLLILAVLGVGIALTHTYPNTLLGVLGICVMGIVLANIGSLVRKELDHGE